MGLQSAAQRDLRIALTDQFFFRYAARFGDAFVQLHSQGVKRHRNQVVLAGSEVISQNGYNRFDSNILKIPASTVSSNLRANKP